MGTSLIDLPCLYCTYYVFVHSMCFVLFQPLKNTGQIPEINGKADSSIAEVNGHCKDEIVAEGRYSTFVLLLMGRQCQHN